MFSLELVGTGDSNLELGLADWRAKFAVVICRHSTYKVKATRKTAQFDALYDARWSKKRTQTAVDNTEIKLLRAKIEGLK